MLVKGLKIIGGIVGGRLVAYLLIFYEWAEAQMDTSRADAKKPEQSKPFGLYD